MPLAAFPKCFLDAICVDKSMTVENWIDISYELDLDGLEFYWNFVSPASPEVWKQWRKKVEAQGRSLPMMCVSPDFTLTDSSERMMQVENHKKAILATAELGGSYCRILSGQKRPEVSRKDGIRWVAECIEQLLPFAEKAGIVLVLENHYKDGFWEYPEFAQKLDLFLELVDAIPESDWFGINYDPSNAIIAGDDPLELLECIKHRVRTMHASDRFFEDGTFEDLQKIDVNPTTGYAGILKHGVIGRGLNDYDTIFKTLNEVGFKGWISIEDGPDPITGMNDLRESALFLRRKMKDYGIS
ncbi:MAG TPA: sugar phosphate isomerase/epimerase [Verrucomicrobiales bacterium]|nr:sugar phosphate isomerase/epimerase [Verrucomicrobiales bacterium]